MHRIRLKTRAAAIAPASAAPTRAALPGAMRAPVLMQGNGTWKPRAIDNGPVSGWGRTS